LKKYLPYLLGFLVLSGLVLLFLSGKKDKERKLNERVTLRKQDKIPYGTSIAYENLPYLFPDATIYTSKQEPGFWDSLSNYDANQAYIVVTDHFNPDSDEVRRLLTFIKNGNDVFISAKSVSEEVTDIVGCNILDLSEPIFTEEDGMVTAKDDSLTVSLSKQYFSTDSNFSYPGRKFSSSFTKLNTIITNELGNGENETTNFIHLKAGKGNFFLHLSPMVFSNYFLLHKNNMHYYEMALSVISPAATKVVWDEYYTSKGKRNRNNEKKKDWFSVFMNMKNAEGKKSFQAAFWVLVTLLALYVLLEMRRKQRYIPVVAKPRNDSMEFVKTIGRLYYDKADHKNLSRKMAAYFQEHVRAKYKLATGNMNDDFIKALQYKSGVPDYEIRGIVSFIKYLDDAPAINQNQLTEFYKQLESFYQKA
jgi:hypothetical protein